ncbi:hypothetical protein IFR04_014016 [Cadophora malorum]|uniref:Tail specific protease domain-containing protein n=1 Tax=Cadophora malorum TaxID=108018 RepID=A0A8H7W0S3_9HELO|nr:hypothetical protein IFR04_014016 [Cadophora malorum]
MLCSFLIYTLICVLLSSGTQAAPSSKSAASQVKREAPPQSTACGDIVRDATVNQFPASKVYECLTSVPFNPAVASRFLKYYKDSVQFQSTLAYLKTPPASYLQPPVDLLGGLDVIQTKIDTGAFANQYEFEATLQRLIYSAHDDHFDLASGILGVFAFGTSYRIVSVSEDGIELPKVYVAADIFQSQRDGNSWEPSPIVTLDGQDVTDYLTRFAAENAIGGRESHTDWNQLMSSPAQVIQGMPSIWGGGSTFYPGEELVIGFENKTTVTTPWKGIFLGDSETRPLETGGDFYNSFVLGWWPASYDPEPLPEDEEDEEDESSAVTSSQTSPTATSTAIPSPTAWNNAAYPSPDIAQENLGTFGGGFLSGYFLQDNIAVLSIPSFQEFGDTVDEYSSVVGRFISTAHSRGMKKVVIDLQRNFGGDALLAIDTFRHFFPKIDPYGGSRLRAQPAANVMGKAMTDYFKTLPSDDDDYTYLYANEWVASTRLNADTNELFGSWEEFFGPHASNGDSFTTTQRYNLEDPLFDSLALEAYTEGFIVTGYDKSITEKPQLFAAEDIVILTDGVCSSTCSMFVEMMHNEAGVKTVVVGGRPSYGPMQAVGLTRGVRSYGIDTQLDSDIADTQAIREFNNQPADFLADRATALEVEITYATLNLRDQVRKKEEIPLQFQYDAADCRIFFTPDTVINFANLWKYAADAIWNKPELCVKESTGYSNTDATDTKLPPASVLPAQAAVETSEVKLGSIINGIFNSNTGPGIEAAKGAKTAPKQTSNQVKATGPVRAEKCKVNPTTSALFCSNPNTICDNNYAYCSTLTPGKKIPRPGCVNLCPYVGMSCGTGTTGGTCMAFPGSEDQLDGTARGYCATPYRWASTKCSTASSKNAVQPGEASVPNKRRRDGDELFAEMEVA